MADKSALNIDLKDKHFCGPQQAKQPYASVSILNPVLTIERHADYYYFSCRFNIETTVLSYESKSGSVWKFLYNQITIL